MELLKPPTPFETSAAVELCPGLIGFGVKSVMEKEKSGVISKLAVTVASAVKVSVHVPVPEQVPLHPVKTEPASGVALTVSSVALKKNAEHVLPQLIAP